MASPFWPRPLFRRASKASLPPSSPQQRTRRPSQARKLCFEQLEDRTMLSAPAPLTNVWQTPVNSQGNSTVSQLGDANLVSRTSSFLGGTFDGGVHVGGIEHTPVGSYGAEGHLNISGRAGLDWNTFLTAGAVAARYNEVLSQNYVEPTVFDQIVTFAPQSGTAVRYTSGGPSGTSFATTSPSYGFSSSLNFGLHAKLGAHFAVVDTVGGETSFGGDLHIPLASLNYNNDQQLKLFSLSLGSGISGIVANTLAGLSYGLSEYPIPTRLHMSFDAHNLDFTQTVWEQAIPGKLGPYADPSGAVNAASPFLASAGFQLGSLEEKFPTITVSSSSAQADGSLTASADVNVADLNLQLGVLASSILGEPPVATTFEIKVAGTKLEFTPISFQFSPALDIGQSARIVPINYLTYHFQDTTAHNPMNVDVFLNGVDQGVVSSVRYRPGIDTEGVRFQGTPIRVVPS